MKILYFDCFNGVSSKLLLSAFADLGVSIEFLKEKLYEGGADFPFDITTKKITDKIPSSIANVTAENDRLLTHSEAIMLAQAIKSEPARCFVISALSNFKSINYSKYIEICACIFAYCSVNASCAISSQITDGSLPDYDVLGIMRRENIPYRILNDGTQRIFKCGISVISSVVNRYGPCPELDIIKIAYGTDGKNYLRLVLGNQKSVSDFFEAALEFSDEKISAFVCGECK